MWLKFRWSLEIFVLNPDLHNYSLLATNYWLFIEICSAKKTAMKKNIFFCINLYVFKQSKKLIIPQRYWNIDPNEFFLFLFCFHTTRLHRYLNVRLISIHCYKRTRSYQKKEFKYYSIKDCHKKNDGGPTDLFHQS